LKFVEVFLRLAGFHFHMYESGSRHFDAHDTRNGVMIGA
jgi:hypothetical protein